VRSVALLLVEATVVVVVVLLLDGERSGLVEDASAGGAVGGTGGAGASGGGGGTDAAATGVSVVSAATAGTMVVYVMAVPPSMTSTDLASGYKYLAAERLTMRSTPMPGYVALVGSNKSSVPNLYNKAGMPLNSANKSASFWALVETTYTCRIGTRNDKRYVAAALLVKWTDPKSNSCKDGGMILARVVFLSRTATRDSLSRDFVHKGIFRQQQTSGSRVRSSNHAGIALQWTHHSTET
jgi:hypothetical protein